jgi:hypothetical protein
MTTDNKYIHNVTTNEITIEPVTAADIKDLADQAKLNTEKAKIREDEAQTNATAKAALLDRLGITAEEAQLLLA